MSKIINKIDYLNNTKINLKNAIENKGVIVGDAPFDLYPDKIKLLVPSGEIAGNAEFVYDNSLRIKHIILKSPRSSLTKMFQGLRNLESFKMWQGFDTKNFTNMDYTFDHAMSTNAILDLRDWDVSNITSMKGTFRLCSAKVINLENWDVSNVMNMDNLFYLEDDDNEYFDGPETINLKGWNLNPDCKIGMYTWYFCSNARLENIIWPNKMYTGPIWLASLKFLSKETVLDLFNKLADVTDKPHSDRPGMDIYEIVVTSHVLNQLTLSEINIATRKGWKITTGK